MVRRNPWRRKYHDSIYSHFPILKQAKVELSGPKITTFFSSEIGQSAWAQRAPYAVPPQIDMPRSAADATRFTATGPYAYSKTGTATTIPVSQPPPNETPSEKVARLRAAAQKARIASASGTLWDRIVLRGQVVADQSHRFTTMTLVALSGLALAVAGWSFVDMAIYNRRKKKEFYLEQQEIYNRLLRQAVEAEARGNMNEDLRIVLENERAIEAAQYARENKKSIWRSAKDVLFAGPKQEDRGGRLAALTREAQAETLEISRKGQIAREISDHGIGDALLANAGTTDMQLVAGHVGGGLLDQLGENTATSLSSASKRWFNWVTGR